MRLLKPLCTAVALAAMAMSGAQAAVTPSKYCSYTGDGSSATQTKAVGIDPSVFSTSDMTYGKDVPTVGAATAPAKDCYATIGDAEGASGGNSTADIINDIWGNNVGALTTWGDEAFVSLVKMNAGSSGFSSDAALGFTWGLDGSVAATTGVWELSVQGTAPFAGLPAYFDFVAVLKGSSDSAAYLFDEVLFDGLGGGSWSMKIDANGFGRFNPANLSNLVVYGRIGDTPPPPPPPPQCGPDTIPCVIPEPGSLALVSLALLGLGTGLVRRRRSA